MPTEPYESGIHTGEPQNTMTHTEPYDSSITTKRLNP